MPYVEEDIGVIHSLSEDQMNETDLFHQLHQPHSILQQLAIVIIKVKDGIITSKQTQQPGIYIRHKQEPETYIHNKPLLMRLLTRSNVNNTDNGDNNFGLNHHDNDTIHQNLNLCFKMWTIWTFNAIIFLVKVNTIAENSLFKNIFFTFIEEICLTYSSKVYLTFYLLHWLIKDHYNQLR